MVVDVLADQRPAAEENEEQNPDRGVEQQTAEEQGQGAVDEARVGGDGVDGDAVDADRREATGLRAVNDHHAHQQCIDLVPCGEPERDRRDDRHGRRSERADRGEHPGDAEHHPRDECDPAPYQADGAPDHEVDGPVVLRDGEQVGDADQRQEQLAGKAADDVVGAHSHGEGADEEGGHEAERAHVHRQHRRGDEHDDERDYWYQFGRHRDLRILLVGTGAGASDDPGWTADLEPRSN